MIDNSFLMPTLVYWLDPDLLAIVTDGENSAKVLASSMALIGLFVFIFSRFFREITARIGLPLVIGDLIAGLVIGVSGLHILVPEGAQINPFLVNLIELVAPTTPEEIQAVFDGPVHLIVEQYAEFGAGLVLLSIGLESNLKQLLKVGWQSATVAVVGLTLPLVFGFLGLIYLFHLPTITALFAGGALTATGLGISAKVMQELEILKSTEGQIILGAAILDNILGLVILAILISIVETGSIDVGNVAKLILTAAIFILTAVMMNLFFGPWFITQLEKLKAPASIGMGSFILFILWSFVAGIIGLESILGAFAAGLILGGTKAREELIKSVSVLSIIFETVFLVSIGAKTDLNLVNPTVASNREGITVALFLITVAITSKIIAGFFAFSSEKINRLGIGTGMVPRGEVVLLFAGLGATTGILPPAINVAIVLMVIATTFLSPPLLRIIFTRDSQLTQP
ncbi:MAG TPA: sodium:proton antiporter [Cyanothece sp. UBA12306]|nr:sodium:proton antiporter [Cyanothece sp. UBA12306]